MPSITQTSPQRMVRRSLERGGGQSSSPGWPLLEVVSE